MLLVYSGVGPLHLHSGWPDSLMGPLMVIHWPDLLYVDKNGILGEQSNKKIKG